MREGISFLIGVGAHEKKWESTLDRTINHLSSKSLDAVTATNYNEPVFTSSLSHSS